MMKVLVDYPSATEEFVIVERAIAPAPTGRTIIELDQLGAMQAQVEQVYVDPALIEYSVRLADATRRPDEVGLAKLARYVTFGASPRASINLVLAARALAFIRGRDYTLPRDLTDLALDVLRHRLVLSYEALGRGRHRRYRAQPGDGCAAGAGRPAGKAADGDRPRPTACCGAWSGRSSVASTGSCRAAYRTVFRGTGIDFADLRTYTPEDDVRHIDWNVTARTGRAVRPPVHEDRELTAWLVLDRSASMRFGGGRARQGLRRHRARDLPRPAVRRRPATESAPSCTTTAPSGSSRRGPDAITSCA